MMLLKTEKARHELMPGVRSLSLRERSLLLLADGKPLHELQAMYHGVGRQIVDDLMRAGYLQPAGPELCDQVPAAAMPSVVLAPHAPLRSLAGTRMYLFDICERMFARRNPSWPSSTTLPCAMRATAGACSMWARPCWKRWATWPVPNGQMPFASAWRSCCPWTHRRSATDTVLPSNG